MNEHQYRTPDGTIADKRTWPIGQAVIATFVGGRRLETTLASVPRKAGGSTWTARIHGAPHAMPLTKLSARFQLGLLPVDPEGVSESDKEIAPPDEGSRGG